MQARRQQQGQEAGPDLHEAGERQERKGEDAHRIAREGGRLIRLQAAQGRYERRIEPAFADDPAHEIGQAEGGQKRIRHGTRPQRLREQNVPGEAENARGHGAEADQQGRADERHAPSRLARPGRNV